MSLTSKQKEMVSQFRSVIGSSEAVALDYLKRCKWNMDQAMDQYFVQVGNPGPSGGSKKGPSKKLEELFDSLKEPTSGYIQIDGIERIAKEISLDLMDPLFLVLSFKFNAKTMLKYFAIYEQGFYKKEEFIEGMQSLACETLSDLKGALKNLKAYLDEDEKFKELYKFTFNFSKDQGCKGLKFEYAQELWKLFFTKRFPLMPIWNEYLDSMPKKNDVTLDQWTMFYEFIKVTKGDISKYEDDGAWPVMIDEFVEYVRKKNSL